MYLGANNTPVIEIGCRGSDLVAQGIRRATLCGALDSFPVIHTI